MLGLRKSVLLTVAASLVIPVMSAQNRPPAPANKVAPKSAAARTVPAVSPKLPKAAVPLAPKPAATASAKPGAPPARVRRTARPPAPQPAPQPVVVQQPPPPPPTPEQMPAVPPRVTYQNGLLTVVAPNSTLADVLNAIRARTGAGIDVPSGGLSERVVASVGPAPPRDVVATLLSGSKFNYIILGSEENPDALQRIILTARSAEPAGGAPGPAAARPVAQPQVNADEGDENVTEDNEPAEMPQPPPPEVQPANQPPPPGTPPTAQPGGVKTPEQLLQELQRMEQQRRQQQQQQTQPPGRPIPPTPEQPPETTPQTTSEPPQAPPVEQPQSTAPGQQPAAQEPPPPSQPPL